MNNQSTLSRTPRGSFNIARQGNTPLSAQGTPQPLSIDEPPDVKNAIIELVKNTVWPSKSSKAQQSLLRAINNAVDIPATTAQLPAGEKEAMEGYIRALGQVHERLKEASTKHGRKQSRKRDKLKGLFRGSKGDDNCVRTLQDCQAAVEAAGDRLKTTQPTAASSQNVLSSGQANHAKGDSQLSQALTTAKAIFTAVEAFSGPIPVAGQYIGGAAKLGLAIVDMWKGMDSNADAAKTLESRMATLADHLKYFESQPREDQKEETSNKIRNLQLQLELVEKEIKALDSKGALSKAFFSRDNAESLKEFQEQVKTAENELHLLISLGTNAVVNKLYTTSLDTNDVVNKLHDVGIECGTARPPRPSGRRQLRSAR